MNTALDVVKRASGASPKKRPVNAQATFSRNAPNKSLNVDMDVDMDMEYFSSSNNLRRTVKNDIAYKPASTMPPLPTFERYTLPATRRFPEIKRTMAEYSEPDPFDCYEVPVARPYDVSEPRNLSRSVHESQIDNYPRKGILRSAGNNGIGSMGYERSMQTSHYRNDASRRFISDENSHLSNDMRVRLQRTPDATQSAGIFSNPYASSPREQMIRQSSNQGYRIVVSNLHGSVNQSDIKELFEDVGPLLDARLGKHDFTCILNL